MKIKKIWLSIFYNLTVSTCVDIKSIRQKEFRDWNKMSGHVTSVSALLMLDSCFAVGNMLQYFFINRKAVAKMHQQKITVASHKSLDFRVIIR